MTTRWNQHAGDGEGEAYARRIADLAATGKAMHGEADMVERWHDGPGRIVDAGCGTGRVGIELARRGWAVVGVDNDESMLEVARREAPALPWVHADLASDDLTQVDPALADGNFDVVLAAGNVIPLLAEGTEAAAIAALAGLLRPTGLFVAGFGLDAAHLPLDDAPVTLADHDRWCAQAGLALMHRLATWEGQPYDDPSADRGYAVSIHRRRG